MRAWYSLPAALLGAGLLLGTGAEAQTTERVSVASDGTEGNGQSAVPAISANGRFVAFYSQASNLIADDTNGYADIFIYDREMGVTERVSTASDGTEGDGASFKPSITAHGRFVAFSSIAGNLVADDTNGYTDVFVHDRDTGVTERVSIASDGTEGNETADWAKISADGRFVAFQSYASTFISGDTNDKGDIFVHDRDTGTTERVSVDSFGRQGNDTSISATISADGRFVAFGSFASNLVAGDTNDVPDIFVHDLESGTTERVSISSDRVEGEVGSADPSISADGRFVAFNSFAGNLVASDTNDRWDVFVHDRHTGITERVSVASDGTEGSHDSYGFAISADGRYVAFYSWANNLVAGDTNGVVDDFLHDRVTGITDRVSLDSDGIEGNLDSFNSTISGTGRFVAFQSEASNLVEGDTNDTGDIFVHDRGAPPQLVVAGACPGGVSVSLTGATPEGQVAFGWGTGEGRFTLPAGLCSGAEIGLADPHRLIVLTAGQDGAISRNETLGAGACGRLLQALDVTTCGPSNVAGLP